MKEEGRQNNTIANGSQSRSMEPEGKNHGRRRTPVACQRCRRRKIKCSGDTEDGQACINCRTSGTPDCVFLRVRALQVDIPCPVLGSNGSLSIRGYHQGTNEQMLSRATLNSASPGYSPYLMLHPGFECAVTSGPNLAHRSPYMAAYPMNYEENGSYSVQQPQSSLLVNGDITDSAGFSSTAKPWDDVCQAKPIHGAFSEQDSGNLASPAYPYMLQQCHSPASPTFPFINSLSAGLPSSDRTLPNPVGYRSNAFATPALETSADSHGGPGSASNYKLSYAIDKQVGGGIRMSRANSSNPSSVSSSDLSRPSPPSLLDVAYGFSSPAVSSCAMYRTTNYTEEYNPGPYGAHSYTYGNGRSTGTVKGVLTSGHTYEPIPTISETFNPPQIQRVHSLAPVSPVEN